MIKIKKQKPNKSEVNKLFDSLKKEDLLEDRAEYDEEDLKLAYPKLNDKEVKMFYLKLQRWKRSKNRKDKQQKPKCLNNLDNCSNYGYNNKVGA